VNYFYASGFATLGGVVGELLHGHGELVVLTTLVVTRCIRTKLTPPHVPLAAVVDQASMRMAQPSKTIVDASIEAFEVEYFLNGATGDLYRP
jgi:hypothetical protein